MSSTGQCSTRPQQPPASDWLAGQKKATNPFLKIIES